MVNNNIFKLVYPVVKKACAAIMEIYTSKENEVHYKEDDSPLTKADIVSNDIICKGLIDIDSTIPIVSEENRLLPYEIRKSYENCWLIDPLDGTKEFVSNNGEFTVNIALIKKGKVVFGIVAAPVSGELYWAKEGKGAFLMRDEQSFPLKVASFNMNDKGIKVLVSRSHLSTETTTFIKTLNDPEVIVAGSALKLSLIASGVGFVYPRFGRTMEWDIAAGQIIIEEAGGVVYDITNNKPLKYNKEDLSNPMFMARGKLL